MQETDVTIVGGGLIGTSLATAIGSLGLSITILEANPIPDLNYDDGRSVALNNASQRIFQSLDIWPYLEQHSTPITKIHISDQGRFSKTRINANEFQVDALGYVLPINKLSYALHAQLKTFENIQLITNAKVKQVESNQNETIVTYELNGEEKQIKSKLLVAADGTNSTVRRLLGITANVKDYNQHGLVFNIEISQAHNHIAYERFTKNGPLALLPLRNNKYAVVWSIKNELLEEYKSLSDEGLLNILQENIGHRIGKIQSIGPRNFFPLKLLQSKKIYQDSTVLLGNAANTLHPIMAQGFNLGLRDVSALAECIQESKELKASQIYSRYQTWREADHKQIAGFTDRVTRIFSNSFLPFVTGRNAGLLATELFKPLKTMIAKKSMGFVGRASKLVRGIPVSMDEN